MHVVELLAQRQYRGHGARGQLAEDGRVEGTDVDDGLGADGVEEALGLVAHPVRPEVPGAHDPRGDGRRLVAVALVAVVPLCVGADLGWPEDDSDGLGAAVALVVLPVQADLGGRAVEQLHQVVAVLHVQAGHRAVVIEGEAEGGGRSLFLFLLSLSRRVKVLVGVVRVPVEAVEGLWVNS